MGWSCCVLEESGELWCLLGESVVFSLGLGEGGMFFFGSNQNKPKLNLFRLFFGLFRETQKHFFRFVLVCFGVSDQSKQPKQTEFS
jgi:hypothetical protein